MSIPLRGAHGERATKIANFANILLRRRFDDGTDGTTALAHSRKRLWLTTAVFALLGSACVARNQPIPPPADAATDEIADDADASADASAPFDTAADFGFSPDGPPDNTIDRVAADRSEADMSRDDGDAPKEGGVVVWPPADGGPGRDSAVVADVGAFCAALAAAYGDRMAACNGGRADYFRSHPSFACTCEELSRLAAEGGMWLDSARADTCLRLLGSAPCDYAGRLLDSQSFCWSALVGQKPVGAPCTSHSYDECAPTASCSAVNSWLRSASAVSAARARQAL